MKASRCKNINAKEHFAFCVCCGKEQESLGYTSIGIIFLTIPADQRFCVLIPKNNLIVFICMSVWQE
jgi:hypothetical protein